jgi:long-chain fatty acid transport protein
MKRRLAGLTAVAVLLFTVSQGFARGLFITPGTRANNLGGAYVAIANDPTAIYWNPAGLAQLQNSGGEISAFYLANDVKGNTSLANKASLAPDRANGDFPLPNVYGLS